MRETFTAALSSSKLESFSSREPRSLTGGRRVGMWGCVSVWACGNVCCVWDVWACGRVGECVVCGMCECVGVWASVLCVGM